MNPAEYARTAIDRWTAEGNGNQALLRDCIVAAIKDAVDEEVSTRDQRILDLERDASSAQIALGQARRHVREEYRELLRDSLGYHERELRRAQATRSNRRTRLEYDLDWHAHCFTPHDIDVIGEQAVVAALHDLMARWSKYKAS